MTKEIWIKFEACVPEYQRFTKEDITEEWSYILQWLSNYEDTPETDKKWRQWLLALPLGYITPIPEHDGYHIVRVLTQDEN